MKLIFTLFLLLTSFVEVYAQKTASTSSTATAHLPKQAKVGDNIQDVVLHNMINYPETRAKISDFKGKLLIMEFWATTCGPCIAMWPKLLTLQKQFGNKIQIVLVNSGEGEQKIRKLIEKRQRLAGINMNLSMVCGDTLIRNYLFPNRSVPYITWVGPDGIIKSISQSSGLTTENIQMMLEGKSPVMKRYIGNDNLVRADFSKPLFLDGNSQTPEQIREYSVMSPAVEGLWPGIGIEKNNHTGHYSAIASNYTPKDMYRLAYSHDTTYFGNIAMVPLSRTVCKLKDSSQYVYQLITPAKSGAQLQKKMRKDLDRIFSARVVWEKRIIPCLVLTMQDSSLVCHGAGDQNVRFLFDENQLVINKVSVAYWLSFFKESTPYHYGPPLIDETGFKGLLGDIKIETDIYNYHKLNEALIKYKMALKLEDRELDVLVIDEPAVADSEP